MRFPVADQEIEIVRAVAIGIDGAFCCRRRGLRRNRNTGPRRKSCRNDRPACLSRHDVLLVSIEDTVQVDT